MRTQRPRRERSETIRSFSAWCNEQRRRLSDTLHGRTTPYLPERLPLGECGKPTFDPAQYAVGVRA